MGGLEYIGLTTAHIWDCTRLAEAALQAAAHDMQPRQPNMQGDL